MLYKQGAGHGGHVLFVQDGRLHYVYNFMGEDEQTVSAPDAVPLGSHLFGVRYERTGTVEGSHTPLGDVSLYIDGDASPRVPASGPTPGASDWQAAGSPLAETAGQAVSSQLQGAVRLHRRHHR